MTDRADVIVVSTQASQNSALDATGPAITAWLAARGFDVAEPTIVSDTGPIAETALAALAGGSRVVITTGGTGVSPTDRTPEVIATLIDREIPGIVEEIRRRGADVGPRSLLTRGVAGITTEGALVVTLPGSRGGVADGLDVLGGVLDHILAQVHGDGHAPRSAG